MKCPPLLRSDSKALIVSPAGKTDAGVVNKAAAVLAGWGLRVEISENALHRIGRFSGFVEQRLSDLQRAMDDPEVGLIFCSRGGYGTVHLLDKLDFSGIGKYPKWLVGYSDITVLHAALQRHGIMSVHGPMAQHFAEEGASDKAVRFTQALLWGEPIRYEIPLADNGYLNRCGEAAGRLFGGNLSVFCSILGSKYAAIPSGGILFFEDVDEEPYKVDRYIQQLKLAGIFDKISGLIVGRFSNYTEDNGMYSTLHESIASSVAEYSFPVCFDFPTGHAKDNLPLIMGKTAKLTVKENQRIFKQH